MQTWPDAETYTGEWSRGLRNGVGKAVFANKDTYVGDFRDGQEHGLGLYTVC